jgi:hypothetical protein
MKETKENLFKEYHNERLNYEHDYPCKKDPAEIIKEITTKIEENVHKHYQEEIEKIIEKYKPVWNEDIEWKLIAEDLQKLIK